jgi:hypothetical protein
VDPGPVPRPAPLAGGRSGLALGRLLAACLAALVMAGASGAQQPPAAPQADAPRPAGGGLRWLPGRSLYPAYIADWKSPEFSLSYIAVADSSIPESGASRVGIKLGTRFAFLRWSPAGAPERPWQLEGEAGFVAQADRDHRLDDIGWDGTYALLLAREVRRGSFLQLGIKHLSSHVGDEYGERTGRLRIGYTRDEVTLAFAHRGPWGLTGYLEGGASYDLREGAGQDRWRVQAGAQREWLVSGHGRHTVVTAVNVELLEELAWKPDVDAQAALQIRAAGDMRWRLGLHYRNGRAPIGEFTRYRESYVLLGAWLQL